MKNPVRNALALGRPVLMDGAMGTELQRQGARLGSECLELWNLTQPDAIRAVHQAYVEAGAECVLTHTFQANASSLTRWGLAPQLEEIWLAAIAHARSVGALVLADVGPISEAEDLARLVACCAAADGILLETWSNPQQVTSFADEMRRQNIDIPLLASFTYRHVGNDLQTFAGATPEVCARAADNAGALVVGANCGAEIGIDTICAIVQRYRAVSILPVLVRPNAGTPTASGYPLMPAQFAAGSSKLWHTGVRFLGGCCGITPAHIKAVPKSPY